MTTPAVATGSFSTASPTAAPLSVAGIRAAIAPVLAELTETARAREGTRDYAFDATRALVRHGATLVGLPVVEGGAGGSLRDVIEVVIDIARADSNVAQALRSTFLLAYRTQGL
ncbi:MAG: acyl-CoA dehydrogenase, partial [Polyangiales bacterium]